MLALLSICLALIMFIPAGTFLQQNLSKPPDETDMQFVIAEEP